MDKKSERLITIITYFSLAFTLGITIFTNWGNAFKIVPLSALLIGSFTLRRYSYKRPGFFSVITKLTFVVDLVCIYFISLLDMSRVSQIYFYILIVDAGLLCSLAFSLTASVMSYLSYVFVRFVRYIKWNYFDFDYFSPAFYENILYFIFVFIIVYIVKRQFIQSQVLSNTMKELEKKSQELGETNLKLRDTMEKLEGMTKINERNRIAREIHDTVGHTLTTVLIEIEAGKRLISKKPEVAVEKLDLAQEQVRKGLNDIRKSVRALKEGNDILSIIPAIESLIRETEKHAEVSIDFSYDPNLPISEAQGKVLFSALQEGLTNGIRHGRCTEFKFSLSRVGNNIFFRLSDNGQGCDELYHGFGLTAMSERVQGLGGRLDIETKTGMGFILTIAIPLKEEAASEENQDTRCG